MSLEWIEHKGKKILYANCKGLSSEQVLQIIEKAFQIIHDYPGKLFILINEQGICLNQAIQSRMKELTIQARERSKASGNLKVQKTAIVGLDAFKSLLLHGYNTVTHQNIVPFKTEEEAKEWLVS